MKLIAMDIGGANTKIFDGKNYYQYYFPMWKEKDKFRDFIENLKKNFTADIYAITMTAELCDCFKNRREGVKFILNTLNDVLGKILVFSTEQKFFDIDTAINFPYSVASANFMATAKYVSMFEKNCIVIDIGSTTTDIIPIKNKKILCHTTDFERIKNDELIYTGVLRTNLVSISNKVKFKGKNLKISAEYFANTGDVYRILGEISENEYTTETADNNGKRIIDCMRRIARILCCDIEEDKECSNVNEIKSKISKRDVVKIAEYFKDKQIKMINKSIERVERKYKINNRFIIGAGKFLYFDLKASLKYADLSAAKSLYFLAKKEINK